AAAAPWIASAPLATHPAIPDLLLHRYDEAVSTPSTTPLELAPAS
ncbi:sirohydrochlorin chelatase, partial [Streptomyces sp. NPDC004976]